jgi:AraC-like DNA-binding protein
MAARPTLLSDLPGTTMEKLNGLIGGPHDELLRFVRVRSAVWCRSTLGAPWGFRVRERPVAAFHFVASGSCVLAVDGVESTIDLRSGDLALVPSGREHVARSDPGAKVRLLDDILASDPPAGGRLRYGGDGATTDLVCGGFAVTDPATDPLLRTLPPVLVVRGDGGAASAEIREVLGVLLQELRNGSSETIVTRLTDSVVGLALRAALRKADGPVTSWRDRDISFAIAAIEAELGRRWTLNDLAATANLSRSAFAERFRAATGAPPMRFLLLSRLARASTLLRESPATMNEIAERVGFASAPAFSRAFRRHFGVAPRTFRSAPASALTGAS